MFYVRDVLRFSGNALSEDGKPRRQRKAKGNAKPRAGGHGGKDVRIVCMDQRGVVLFDLSGSKTEFSVIKPEMLRKLHANGSVEVLAAHDYDKIETAPLIGVAQRERRDRNYEYILPLLERSDIFDRVARGHAVASRVREINVVRAVARIEATKLAKGEQPATKIPDIAPSTLHRLLDAYWRRGMRPDALLPAFHKIGQLKRRTPKKGKFLGAIPTEGIPRSLPIDENMRKLFSKMTREHYTNKRQNSLAVAYKQIKGHLTSDVWLNPKTNRIEPKKEVHDRARNLPTMRQFRYWYKTSNRVVSDQTARQGSSRYLKDNRATTGSSSVHLHGVGSRFEIDATMIDVGCVSGTNRRQYVGRPSLYIVVDVYSKLIVGIHLGFDPPSWDTARLALRNVAEDKVAYCERYGVSIDAHEWPCSDILPARILADRGEFEGYDASAFVNRTGVTIENTAPYRGDMKGSVEKRFDMIHRHLRSVVPGAVDKNHAERGDSDYRRKAKLNLRELTAIVIRIVLFLNNDHALVGHHQPADMRDANILPVPLKMWDWAISVGRTELKRFSYGELEFEMLKKRTVSASRDGIVLEKLLFVSQELQSSDLFNRNESQDVTVSWDSQSTNQIWRHRGNGTYEKCPLSPKRDAQRNMTFAEANSVNTNLRVQIAQAAAEESARFEQMHLEIRKLLDLPFGESPTDLTAASMSRAAAAKVCEQVVQAEAERERKDEILVRRARERDARPSKAKPSQFNTPRGKFDQKDSDASNTV